MKDSLPLPEDRFIKLSLEHISFIVIFLLAIQKDYPKEDDKKLIMENDDD